MEDRSVRIAPELYAEAEALVAASGAFASVEEYVNFVLAELFEPAEPRAQHEAERRELERRLRQLGYA
jgi:Arc/MetJ-type ribon-helix-helix transcriptional regulator